MRMFDTSPLLRSAVGFDNINRLIDSVTRIDTGTSGYPPYNIEKVGEDDYRISMAVAGFTEDDLDITVEDGTLEISGQVSKTPENQADQPESAKVYLHRGIANRAFTRRFQLADTVKVIGAHLENGLLHVDLQREIPEERKPRKIAINAVVDSPKAVDQKAA